MLFEEILKKKRLGARGFAWIRVWLLLRHLLEVISSSLSCAFLVSSFGVVWDAWLCDILVLEDGSEVATSDLEWRSH